MTYLPDGRVGIRGEVNGFVVHEDQSLEARLRRSYQAARVKAQEAVEQAREKVGQIGQPSELDRALEAEAETAPGISARVAVHLRDLRAHLASAWDRTGHVASVLIERLQPADRVKDLGALLWTVLRFFGRLFLRLPTTGKLIVGTLALLAALTALPADDEEGAVAVPVQLRTGEAVQPVKFNPDLWKSVAAPIAGFHLEAPELDRSTMRYRARIHADGARQDILVWGGQAVEAPRRRLPVYGALAIELYPGTLPDRETLYLDSARRAALVATSVERMGESIGLETKFGVFETADATLSNETGRRSCLAFRHVADAVPFQVHGWFCGAPDRPIDRSALGCMLDRIDILSAGKDQALRSYFAAVERARKPCGTAKLVTAKPDWIDPAGQMPALKASILPVASR